MLHRKFPVCCLMEGLGFEAISQAKERKTQEVVDKGPGAPPAGHGPMRQSRKQLGEDSFPTAPGTLEAGRISSRPEAFARGPAG